jgi:putative protein-disulfide isomerase
MEARLLYVADPMCSWCFGFAPVLEELRHDLEPFVRFELVLGGLAPDDDSPMTLETRRYVQEAWRAVESRTGVRFEWSFWEKCEPRRSTWPACRAVLAAGEHGEAMFKAIQRAYYREARDPSDPAVLVDLGAELGLDGEAFARRLDSADIQAELSSHFQRRDHLGARSYPSLALERDGSAELISCGWTDPASLRSMLDRAGLLRPDQPSPGTMGGSSG